MPRRPLSIRNGGWVPKRSGPISPRRSCDAAPSAETAAALRDKLTVQSAGFAGWNRTDRDIACRSRSRTAKSSRPRGGKSAITIADALGNRGRCNILLVGTIDRNSMVFILRRERVAEPTAPRWRLGPFM